MGSRTTRTSHQPILEPSVLNNPNNHLIVQLSVTWHVTYFPPCFSFVCVDANIDFGANKTCQQYFPFGIQRAARDLSL